MRRELAIAIRMALATLLLTGIAYPLTMTGLAQVLFPHQANGGLIHHEGRIVGSTLIGQRFSTPAYFHGRPSAAGAEGYDASASGGSNLGPTSGKLRDRVAANVESLRTQNPSAPGPAPVDLITASGSGLDPHVSPEAARWQAPRVATARGVPLAAIETLIETHIEPPYLGVLGDPRVNVLRLNLVLDKQFGAPLGRGD